MECAEIRDGCHTNLKNLCLLITFKTIHPEIHFVGHTPRFLGISNSKNQNQ